MLCEHHNWNKGYCGPHNDSMQIWSQHQAKRKPQASDRLRNRTTYPTTLTNWNKKLE